MDVIEIRDRIDETLEDLHDLFLKEAGNHLQDLLMLVQDKLREFDGIDNRAALANNPAVVAACVQVAAAHFIHQRTEHCKAMWQHYTNREARSSQPLPGGNDW